MDKLYYEPQDNWTREEYYYLHRQLHRLFYYYKKYSEEISKMDVDMMSDETKAMIYCIIKYYNYDFLFTDYSNLTNLSNIEPLKETLVLNEEPLPEDNVYKHMNILY